MVCVVQVAVNFVALAVVIPQAVKLGKALTGPDPNQVPRNVPRDQRERVAALCQDEPQTL